MNQILRFFVPGLPKPGGSKRAFINKKTGRPIVTEDCNKNPEWRQDVKTFARRAIEAGEWTKTDKSLSLRVRFVLPRTKGHFGTGRNSRILKTSAPMYPKGKPDLTKLVRALEDALTGIAWVDDAQIVDQGLSKAYEEPNQGRGIGAAVTIIELGL